MILIRHQPARRILVLTILLLFRYHGCIFTLFFTIKNLRSYFKVCKLVDSPSNSPSGRRSSIGVGYESSGSRSRDRTSCVVPSPLAATNTIEDIDGEYKTNSSSKERKDFSRLFVPIQSPSPGAMDCCGDSEESLGNNHLDFSTSKIRETVSKEYSVANGKSN
jgi:hypothetical protein